MNTLADLNTLLCVWEARESAAWPPADSDGKKNVAFANNRLRAAWSQLRILNPAVTNLARYASGLIENSRIPEIDKIEIQLRLAEMQSEMENANSIC